MSAEDNKKLVHSFFEKAYIQHDLDAAAELITRDYCLHDPTRPDFAGGVDAFKRAQKLYLDAISAHDLKINEQIAEGDRVVTRWTVTGTQRADLPGIPNRGCSFKVGGITISRVSDGHIAEEWQDWDDAGLRRQLCAC
ncbi:MAG: ester cyclase [Desulfomonile tiedjei]|nr:ester cyclase [Desulfomonile tiedjei]